MQTKNPVLTRRAQLPQMPPPSWRFSFPLPPGKKSKASIHQGFGKNRLCAWGIKRRVARFWALDSRPCLTGQRTGPRHTLSCLEVLTLSLLQRSLPPIYFLQFAPSNWTAAPAARLQAYRKMGMFFLNCISLVFLLSRAQIGQQEWEA